jgi:hypothetical protein
MILEGIMFILSGLGYYSGVLIFRPIHLDFSFKLFELQRLDQDGDGIVLLREDLTGIVT